MKNICITKPYMPDKDKYKKYIDEIFDRSYLTNGGPLVDELESRLAKFLGVKHLVLVANGTIALQVSFKALALSGNVITSPFSFIATSSSLVWQGLQPKFVDIDADSFNLNPALIEQAIDSDTSAILPVHVFGNACKVEVIAEIAKNNDLKLIYDAAHAFDVHYKGQSLLNQGDISILSFHATKLFHTIEGGAILTNDDQTALHVRQMINFGFEKEESIVRLGINGKMNEFEAAMGLCVLDEYGIIRKKRKQIYDFYLKHLDNHLQRQELNMHSTQNYGYFPILFDDEKTTLEIKNKMRNENIYARRYFAPSLDMVSYFESQEKCPVSQDIASRILCLPVFPDLDHSGQQRIIDIINRSLV